MQIDVDMLEELISDKYHFCEVCDTSRMCIWCVFSEEEMDAKLGLAGELAQRMADVLECLP